MEQHSIEWYKARLGKITGSMVYSLMGTPRKKGEVWTDTAKSYLYELAAERRISETYLTTKFDEWLQRTNVETWAMRYGTETESQARDSYNMTLPDGLTVKECGFILYEGLQNYGDSPDGLVINASGEVERVLEIKCPNPATWMRYKAEFAEGITLKDIEPKYWWQVQSHMLATGCGVCDFVYFDKMLKDGLQVVSIEANDEDILLLREKITAANEFINSLI